MISSLVILFSFPQRIPGWFSRVNKVYHYFK